MIVISMFYGTDAVLINEGISRPSGERATQNEK